MVLCLDKKPYYKRLKIWKNSLYNVNSLINMFVENLNVVFAKE